MTFVVIGALRDKSLPTGKFCMLFLSSVDFIFFEYQLFLKIYIRNTIRVSNSSDPDQARHFVRPGLDTNCLQRLSAGNTIVGKELKLIKSCHQFKIML